MMIEAITLKEIAKEFSTAFNGYIDFTLESLKNPSWNNPFYIVPSICIITFILEVILPKKKNYSLFGRKGFFLDLFYVFFIDFLLNIIGFYAMTSVVESIFRKSLKAIGINSIIIADIHDLPFFIQFLVAFILVDFMQWFGHYLLHRFNFLWQFHKIHHAQEELGFASTRHFHWFEYFVFKPLLYIPFNFLNFSVAEFVGIYLWFGLFFTFFSHCNVKVNWKWFNLIFISPETHYWHHAKNIPHKFGVNYASTLTLWDHLFGFYYYPKDKEPILGVPDQKEIPSSFLGQMIHPFKELFVKKKKNIQMIEEKPLQVKSNISKQNVWKKKKK